MTPGPEKVAIAELPAKDAGTRVASVPQLVANNVSVLQQMSRQLHDADEMTVEDIVAAQVLLLGDLDNSGLRDKQNWIGGSSYSPLEAEFVPPPPERVPDVMGDLVDYLNGATHGAVIQATAEAADHAQRIAEELESLRQEWRERVDGHRREQGKTRGLRTDSMTWRVLENLPDDPLLTGPAAAEVFDTSRTSAGKALESLVEAGVLRKNPSTEVSPAILLMKCSS